MKSAPWGSSRVTQPKQPYNKRLIWAGLSIVLILTLALLFTPVGRALANEILHFFVRAPGNTLQLPPAEIVEIIPSGTPLPTYFPTLLPADQVRRPHYSQLNR